MKIALLQTHSKNNEALYELTLKNHVKYCDTHNYDMVQINCEYSSYMDFNLLNFLFNYYDVVFTMGSDVIITNYNIPLTSFINLQENKSLYIDINGNDDHVIVNFDFCVWVKNENTQKIIEYIEETKRNIPTLKNKDNFVFGTQSIIDYFIRNNHPACEYIKLLEPRKLQSLPPTFVVTDINRNNFWVENDFSIHFFCGDNKYKYDKCYEFMKTHNLL